MVEAVTGGLMQEMPLTVDRIIGHAGRWHGNREIVSRSFDGSIARTTYAMIEARARQLSATLQSLGVCQGTRVATLAWNHWRHIEAWYGIMGIGGVCHTLNPRLLPEQIGWIAADAEDEILFADPGFEAIVMEILRHAPSIRHVVMMCRRDEMPDLAAPSVLCFEDLIEADAPPVSWGGFAETTACGLCYTSGTTGNPKGVLYSHRSNYLHTLAALAPDMMALSEREVVMPVVPMYHANAWGLAFSAPAAGAKLVLPGSRLDGQSLYELLEGEGVTFALAVTTVWQGLLSFLDTNDLKLSTLKRVLIGGAAVPGSLMRDFADRHGVTITQGWGMTELSPIGTISTPTHEIRLDDIEAALPTRTLQGRPPLGVDLAILDDDGVALPHDGQSVGRLVTRGDWVAAGYYKRGTALDDKGWFDTGDVGTIDPRGFLRITDRAKDVIKSGGEWISSIDIENVVCGHPDVAIAAVIGVPHPKWDERPILIVNLHPWAAAGQNEIAEFLDGRIAKWWMPDEIRFDPPIPLGATGKVDKKALRQTLSEMTAATS